MYHDGEDPIKLIKDLGFEVISGSDSLSPIIDEIIEIIRFQDNPEDTIIDQKLEEIKKILNR